ncbi:MAG: (deoxy)nucleoside triphosphate pyrophosphohydrolase, partial [Sutterellaceae bacterium]|nr:(deoxy)nucleoside triphosphate pyrophosphohydrolase [Sutterellaceae bacterium]
DGWECPGGKVAAGETPEEAIVREIQEELHVTITPEKRITTVEYDYPNFHLTMHCFVSRIASGTIELVEHEAMKWLAKDELDTVAWLPADVEVVEALKVYLA